MSRELAARSAACGTAAGASRQDRSIAIILDHDWSSPAQPTAAEKLAALMTEEYLAERAKRGSVEEFKAVLAKAPKAKPVPGDDLNDGNPAVKGEPKRERKPPSIALPLSESDLRVHALYGLGTLGRKLAEQGEAERADAIARVLVQQLEQAPNRFVNAHALRGISNSDRTLTIAAVAKR